MKFTIKDRDILKDNLRKYFMAFVDEFSCTLELLN